MVPVIATTNTDTILLSPVRVASTNSPPPDDKHVTFTAIIKAERVALVAPSVSISSANEVVSASTTTDGDITLLPPMHGESLASPPLDGKNMAFATAIKSELSVIIISANNVVSMAATTDDDTTPLSPVHDVYSNSPPPDNEHVLSTAITPNFPSAYVKPLGAKPEDVLLQQRYRQHPYPRD